jgi:hypothetical protein
MTVYECKKCLFTTSHKPNYTRHLSTNKHKNNHSKNDKITENNEKSENNKTIEIKNNIKSHICKSCSEHFSSRQSLHRHAKSRCKVIKENEIINNERRKELNKIKTKMTGWIYCITNPLYKMDDTYKLGYTANKESFDLVKKSLIQRYSTYYPNVECIELFEVKRPLQAEKEIFNLLKDYKYSNELIKADYDMIIKPHLGEIKYLYKIN